MSSNAIGQPGFGIGAHFGVPVTVAVASSTTVNITGAAYITTQYLTGFSSNTILPADLDLISLQAFSTSNGVTATYYLGSAAGATFWNDNTSFRIANTASVSVNVVLVQA